MSLHDLFPSVGAIVEVSTIRLVSPYHYRDWQIVAEADVIVSGSGGGRGKTVVGKIPIEEISSYPDFDPAHRIRSRKLRRDMCRVLLLGSDRRFLVIDCDEASGEIVLSLKQAVLRERTVAHTDHTPPYVVQGFRNLQNLHYHLLKHPLGLGGGTTDWPALLNVRYWREGILRRLQTAGCPAARQYDGRSSILTEGNPCAPCAIAQKLRCFLLLQTVRKPYEQQAAACVTQASDKVNPRHYHYSEDKAGEKRAVLVFMDEQCRKVVAKRGEEPHFTAATFFQPEDCDPGAPDIRLKYLKERRQRIAPAIAGAGYSDVTICTPLSWGYQ